MKEEWKEGKKKGKEGREKDREKKRGEGGREGEQIGERTYECPNNKVFLKVPPVSTLVRSVCTQRHCSNLGPVCSQPPHRGAMSSPATASPDL